MVILKIIKIFLFLKLIYIIINIVHTNAKNLINQNSTDHDDLSNVDIKHLTKKEIDSLKEALKNDEKFKFDLRDMALVIEMFGLSHDMLMILQNDAKIEYLKENNTEKINNEKKYKEKRYIDMKKNNLKKKEILTIFNQLNISKNLTKCLIVLKQKFKYLNITNDDLNTLKKINFKQWNETVDEIFKIKQKIKTVFKNDDLPNNNNNSLSLNFDDFENLNLDLNQSINIFHHDNFDISEDIEHQMINKKVNCSKCIDNKIFTDKKKQHIANKNDGEGQLSLDQICTLKHELYYDPEFRDAFQKIREEIKKLNMTREELIKLRENISKKCNQLKEKWSKEDIEKERKSTEIKQKGDLIAYKKGHIETKENQRYKNDVNQLQQNIQSLRLSIENIEYILRDPKRLKRYVNINDDDKDENYINKTKQSHQYQQTNSTAEYLSKDAFKKKSYFGKEPPLVKTNIKQKNNILTQDIIKFIPIFYFPLIYISIGLILCYIIQSTLSIAGPRKVILTTDH